MGTLLLLKLSIFPLYEEITRQEEALRVYPAQQTKVFALEKKLLEQQACLKSVVVLGDSLQAELPRSMTEVTRHLFKLGSQAGIQIRSTTPHNQDVSLVLSGSYDEVYSFLMLIYENRVRYTITKLEMKRAGKLQVSLGISCTLLKRGDSHE